MRNLPLLVAILVFGTAGYGNTPALFHITATPPQSQVTIPAGTRILVRMVDSIDSINNKAGDKFTATLETNLMAVDTMVVPKGATVYGRLTNASSAGRMSGSSQLTLELTDIVIRGTAYPILTSNYEVKGKGEGSKTAKKVVGGAGLGALIGGIAGGGTGAAIGALSGGALGTGVAASKKGQQLSIPSESLLEFRLQQPAPLPVSR
jgi:outer membrane lipoprotein SlyB